MPEGVGWAPHFVSRFYRRGCIWCPAVPVVSSWGSLALRGYCPIHGSSCVWHFRYVVLGTRGKKKAVVGRTDWPTCSETYPNYSLSVIPKFLLVLSVLPLYLELSLIAVCVFLGMSWVLISLVYLIYSKSLQFLVHWWSFLFVKHYYRIIIINIIIRYFFIIS